MRHHVFQNEGCFNRLPQNGFIGFWPHSFYEGEQLERVIDTAERIHAEISSLRERAKKLVGADMALCIDTAIIEDDAIVGNYDGGARKSYTLLSDGVNGLMALPSLLGRDGVGRIVCPDEMAGKIKKYRQLSKMKIKLAGRPVYEIK
jgi:hypothetical protein